MGPERGVAGRDLPPDGAGYPAIASHPCPDPSSASDAPITDHRQLAEVLASGRNRARRGGSAPSTRKFGFRLDDLRPPEFDGERGIEALLEGMVRFGWRRARTKGDGTGIALTRAWPRSRWSRRAAGTVRRARWRTIHDTCCEVGHTTCAR